MACAVRSDGTPAMLVQKYDFGALVKADAPHIAVTHCVLNSYALATKTFTPNLAKVLQVVVECVNYLQNSAVKHRIFKKLCDEMGSKA